MEFKNHILLIAGSPDASDLRRAIRAHDQRPVDPFSGPIRLAIRIGVSRAQAAVFHARRFPVGQPDALALAARALDAATGILWRSRAQVVAVDISRHYTATPYIEFDFYEICTPEENAHAPTTIARGRA
jgi:Holliday junction resolvase RusA-like endonuclease